MNNSSKKKGHPKETNIFPPLKRYNEHRYLQTEGNCTLRKRQVKEAYDVNVQPHEKVTNQLEFVTFSYMKLYLIVKTSTISILAITEMVNKAERRLTANYIIQFYFKFPC